MTIHIFKYGLLAIRGNALLLCEPYAFTDYILPGGTREGTESAESCLSREVREELGPDAVLQLDSLQLLGIFSDRAAGRTDRRVTIEAYLGRVDGRLVASSEIRRLVWFRLSDDHSRLSAIVRNQILPVLQERGILR
jgi:ADP-ribose pyrophosphatase YjhB (NUDIX family)